MKFVVLGFAYGWYQYYMPIYAFSVLYNNPDAFVRFVILDAEILPLVATQLNFLRSSGFTRFEVLHKPRLGLPGFGGDNYERFLLDRSYFSDFDYAWIGDIDFLIWSKSPVWLDTEISRANSIGFPYSNVVREGLLHDCMVGWHFIIVKPYFDLMQPVIDAYKSAPYSLMRPGIHPVNCDERLLYEMIREGIGVCRDGTAREGHGMHLGTYRIGHSQPEWIRLYDPWKSLVAEQINHPVLKRILKTNSHPEMVRVIGMLKEDFGRKIKLL